MIVGTHNSCTQAPYSYINRLVWPWCQTQNRTLTQQWDRGARLFDLRYASTADGDLMVSHSWATSYSLRRALAELARLATRSRILVRLKRDASCAPLAKNGLLHRVVTETPGLIAVVVPHSSTQPPDLTALAGMVLYCDDDSLHEDQLGDTLWFPQLFNTVELWRCSSLQDALTTLLFPRFEPSDPRPKALFIDYSGVIPPFVLDHVFLKYAPLATLVSSSAYDCVMVNFL